MNRYLSALSFSTLTVLLAGWFTPVAVSADDSASSEPWFSPAAPDQSDWSKKRISKFARVDYRILGAPQAAINIPDLDLSAAIYPDSESLALEAGAAWVSGTARPGESGNVAIAGHRDSFFRPLENIPLGTRIELATPNGNRVYVVHSVEIVDALDVSPLEATDNASLTLITCHPFRFKGYAPDRYIVRAVLEENDLQQTDPASPVLQTSMANTENDKEETL